jgi:hypothetical protein
MTCFMDDPKWRQCCCKCAHHIPTHEHCSTNQPLRDEKKTCICDIQNGWACVPPGFDRVHINWPEHSVGCEMFQKVEIPQ